MTNLDSVLKIQCIKNKKYFANKCPHSQSYGFSSCCVWMWELNHKESWALKNWCFWTVVLEKTFESPLGWREIQPVHPKGNQSWISIGRTNADAETPIHWPPDVKNWVIRKDPDAGQDWKQEALALCRPAGPGAPARMGKGRVRELHPGGRQGSKVGRAPYCPLMSDRICGCPAAWAFSWGPCAITVYRWP